MIHLFTDDAHQTHQTYQTSSAEALHNVYSAYHRATVQDEPEEEDEGGNGADMRWGLCGEAEDEKLEEEAEDIDEEGLRAYERLSETFERELEEIGAYHILVGDEFLLNLCYSRRTQSHGSCHPTCICIQDPYTNDS